MKTYSVVLPITGTLFIPNVRAHNEEDAIEKALFMDYNPNIHDLFWSKADKIIEGNVFYGDLSEAYATEEKK